MYTEYDVTSVLPNKVLYIYLCKCPRICFIHTQMFRLLYELIIEKHATCRGLKYKENDTDVLRRYGAVILCGILWYK